MKKILLILGSLLLIFISAGTLFKLMHWPGGSLFIVVGLFFLSCVWIPLFFIERMFAEKKLLNIVVNIFALLSVCQMFIGVLFKIQHWPGASLMLITGSLLFLFPTLLLYVIQQFKVYDKKFSEFWKLLFLSVIASLFFLTVGISFTRSSITSFVKMEEATLKSNRILIRNNDFLYGQVTNDYDGIKQVNFAVQKVNNNSKELYFQIEEIKKEILLNSGEGVEAIENHWLIHGKDFYDVPSYMLGMPNSEKGKKLHTELIRYNNVLEEAYNSLPKNVLTVDLTNLGINTELNPEMMSQYTTWHEGMFNDVPMVATLALLTGIQNEVLNAEFMFLSTVTIAMK